MSLLLPIINVVDGKDPSVTVLLGFNKYICRGFSKNNIQVTGSWYLIQEDIDIIVESISDYIKINDATEVNFIGVSKSCTGGFILASILAAKYKNVVFRIFAFSGRTILNKEFYEERGLIDAKIAPSLLKVWKNKAYKESLELYGDARFLIEGISNIEAYLLYPAPSRGHEPLMVERMEGLDNVKLIPLEVRLHGILYPFWKPVSKDSTIEAFEGQVIKLPDAVYEYFHRMQNYEEYKFDLYSLVYDTDDFIYNMKIFNSEFI